MASASEKPKITRDAGLGGNASYHIKHPAYGIISVSRPTGGSREMFGSDIRHDRTVRIQLKHGYEERHLNSSTYYARGNIAEFEMTETQWARFVSSNGAGGTPVTLKSLRDEDGLFTDVPSIEGQLNEIEKAKTEFKSLVRSSGAGVNLAKEKLQGLLAKGKATKKELQEISALLDSSIGRFAEYASFSEDMFIESMETIVEESRSTLEAHMMQTAKTLGIDVDAIQNRLLENKE